MTSDTTVVALRQPEAVEDPLTAVLRSGARRLLAQAVEAEVEAFLAEMRDLRLPDGSRLSAVMEVTRRPAVSIRRARLPKVFLADLVGNGTLDEGMAAQLAEELLEIGERDLLPVGHAGEGRRPLGAVHRDVDHRRNRKSSFGRETHGVTRCSWLRALARRWLRDCQFRLV